ncbi:hypothetical protein DBR40_17000 [Pedobacter sp. KBW01]|uniref:hypothetical protein n=1 Tax=Pedobacter sp. KBW01 TaxID=2153364 RepID=UPI000F59CD33|nr:hypothetical protein [Pedobacter sp. KBW01]RQO71496.1 hypothetical protein DBR40_17000 [Pedobacter sp. KBW01]
MVKYLLAIFIACFIICSCKAQTGCRTGDYIYITANGTYNDGGSTIIKYNSTDRIAKRNYAEDPVCGIDRNTADGYPIVPGTPTNPDSKCVSDINLTDEGKLVYYNNADNTCVSVPIDRYIHVLLVLAGIIGGYYISKFSIILC